ncbi:U6 snRNA-associated Sm-like protein LSm1 isoform X2 [Cynoglossus semilaevis]|uniref:U6 snRNA-associated Sm-like protein LSm1 isoform X2 n=1 Tax=Cynoglossus semilaevis TaxID=244447 RepID=UPI000496791C|nr:U6 snRNA-associated Sm-like protein LSm1 isoform X2 [Cynoglossus semilaevis]
MFKNGSLRCLDIKTLPLLHFFTEKTSFFKNIHDLRGRTYFQTELPAKERHKMNYVPGTTSLIDDIDTNLVFHQTVERIHVGKKFGDIPRGIFIVRGENVVLLGEIDVDKACDTVLQQVSIEEILEEQRLQQQAKQETEKVKKQVLKDRGLSVPKADNLDEY